MTLFFALLAASAPIASPVEIAATSPSADNPQVTAAISTEDLDLTAAADRKQLDRRIARAAARICRGLSTSATLLEQSACASHAVQEARDQREVLIARAFYARTRELNGGGVAGGSAGLLSRDGAGFR